MPDRALLSAVGPYGTRLAGLYVLLMADAIINATADTTAERQTTWRAASVLAVQVLIRVGCMISTVGLLSSSRTWRDDLLLEFCGLFAISLVGLITCLFLRVYRVTLSAFPSRFPTVLDYWNSTEYCLLLLAHVLLSLLFYWSSITAAHRMGSAKYFHRADGALQPGAKAPSIYAAVHLASSRR